jgi:hypothetical protein
MTQAPYRALAFIILFVILLGIARTALNNYTNKKHMYELFIPSFTVLVDEKPDKLTISVPKNLKASSLLRSGIKNIQVKEFPKEFSKGTDIAKKSLVIDAFTAKNIIGKDGTHHFLTTIDTERTAYFIRSLETSSKGFVEDGVRIGYVGELDSMLIKQLMWAKKNNNTMSSYSVKQIVPTSSINTRTFEDNGIDVLFVYETLGNDSQGITKSIDKNMKLEVWDYAHTLDIHKLKVSLPFIKHKNIDFSLHFPQLKGKIDIVSSVVAFDNVIMLSLEDASNSNITLELQKLLNYYNKPENINLYERYFSVSDVATEYVKERTQFFLERGSKQILEQFEQSNNDEFVFDVQENVNGFFDSQSKMFYMYSDSIKGIPLKRGSLFKFYQQMREEQNGVFKVVNATPKQSILEKVRDLEVESKATKLQPGYLCYNRPDITSKASCQSPYDNEGNLKRQKTYWDKPCEKHTECPFYQANKNYKNYRGGCIDGRCEMPIGVKSVSYRLYDKEASTSLCHNCKGLSPTCCEEQKDKSKYPSLKGPDYAFELDEYERPLQLLAKNLP